MKQPFPCSITLSLPDWAESRLDPDALYPHDEDKMRLAVDLSELNIKHHTGGPFGAALFGSDSGRLISMGVNRVVPERCSVAHAEMMAFMLAHTTNHAAQEDIEPYVLASSAQPCSMCFGALPWTQVNRLLYGATREDVETIVHFDEGPLHPSWKQELTQRQITVKSNILRKEACRVLQSYADTGGEMY